MRRFIALITISLMLLSLTGCGDGPVGYWQISEVSAGDITMTQEDAQLIGQATVGSVKLQKSGNCVVNLLGEEFEGTWTQADDGTITVTYGDDDSVLTGSISDEGIMTLSDNLGSEYTLSK